MRKVLLALAAMTLPSAAGAADYMRGPVYDSPVEQRYDWSGTYFGGHGGFTQAKLHSFGSVSVSDPLGLNAPVTVPLGSGSVSGASYGGFIGYNASWEDIILGFEFGYTRFNESADYTYTYRGTYIFSPLTGAEPATITATSSTRITDLFNLRARAGYSMGWVMPYVTVGAVVARGDASTTIETRDATGALRRIVVPVGSPPGTPAFSTTSATPFGFSVGAGVDLMITQNVFARAEIEYVGLRESKGVAGQLTTYRAGIGLKF